MEILNALNERYPMRFDRHELLRDGGSTSYAVFSGGDKYFLRAIKPAFFDTAVRGADIQAFLHNQGFPVPPVIRAKDGKPYVQTADGLLILYAFVEGGESDPERDAEEIGALTGRLHNAMKGYRGGLVKRDKHFYVGRYVEILKKKQYPKTDEFKTYGNELWEKVKDLPRGYCHGDMYCGNIHKTPGGAHYILDFDTSCEGFPMYDPALICNRTDYFNYDENGYERSKAVFSRFLPEYLKYNPLEIEGIDAFFDFIALYHFALQATIIEMYGLDCVDGLFLDRQLDWLYKWRAQCERGTRI